MIQTIHNCPLVSPADCRLLASRAREALNVGRVPLTPAALAQVIRSAPRTPREGDDPCPEQSFCVACLDAAKVCPMTGDEYRRYEELVGYFLDELPSMARHRPRALESVVLATLTGMAGDAQP